MPSYFSTAQLPESVRAILTNDWQTVWLAGYNAAFSIVQDDEKATQSAWTRVLSMQFPMENPAEIPQTASLSETKAYWVDVSSFKLEEDATSWIQAFPVGEWHHPKHGKIVMTPERAQRFAQNVNANVRGQELDIDYDHKEKTNEASGWVKAAQAKADGLWLQVQWTKEAAQKIKDKAYRYFSPEYLDEWEEPRSKSKLKDVLLGGALTNRPFLKGILPVNLSEVLSNTQAHNDRRSMDWNEMRVLLGLPDGTTEEATKSEFAKRLGTTPTIEPPATTPPVPPVATAPAPQATPPAPVATQTPAPVAASDAIPPEVRTLAETDPVVKALTDRIDTLEAATRLSEISVKLSALDTEQYAVNPAAKDALRSVLLKAPKSLSDEIFNVATEILKNGITALGEIGHQTHVDNNDPSKRFADRVDALIKADTTLSYADAVERVSAQEPALFNEYRNATYLKESAK